MIQRSHSVARERISSLQVAQILNSSSPEFGQFTPHGSGFLAAENILITASHVIRSLDVDQISSHLIAHFGSPQISCNILELLMRDEAHDVSVLRLDGKVGPPAPIIFGQTERLSNRAGQYAALGYPLKMIHKGNASFLLSAEDFEYSGRAGTVGGPLDNFQVRGGLDQGFSGGPLIAHDHPFQPVLGMAKDGGEDVSHSRFVSGTVLVRLLWSLGIDPPIIHWNEFHPPNDSPSFTENADLWSRALELGGQTTSLDIENNGIVTKMLFRVIPPSAGHRAPFLISEQVIPGSIIGGKSGNNCLAGFSFNQASRFAQNTQPKGCFDLPTEAQLIAALTCCGTTGMPSSSGGTRSAAISSGRLLDSGIRATPNGFSEFVKTVEGGGWLELPKSINGVPRSGTITDFDRSFPTTGFRLCMSASAWRRVCILGSKRENNG